MSEIHGDTLYIFPPLCRKGTLHIHQEKMDMYHKKARIFRQCRLNICPLEYPLYNFNFSSLHSSD